MIGKLPINPPDDVATGNVPDEQEQAVRTLVQPTVPKWMSGQGAIAELVRFGAGLESLVVPAAGERPIPLQLVAPGVGGERPFNFCPRHIAMPIHVPLGHSVGDSLEAQLADQPIEDHSGVMVFDCSNEPGFICVIPQIVDAGNRTGKVAYPPNNRSRMPHALGLTRNGDPACHVRSTQLTGVERRYRRRCTAGLSEWTGDRREFEHRVTTRLPCALASQHG